MSQGACPSAPAAPGCGSDSPQCAAPRRFRPNRLRATDLARPAGRLGVDRTASSPWMDLARPTGKLGVRAVEWGPLDVCQAMPWAAGLRHWLRVPKRQGFPVDTQDGPHPPRIPRHTRRTASAKDSHKTDHIRQGFPVTEDGPHKPRIPRHRRRTTSAKDSPSQKTDHIRQGFPITEDGPHPPRIPRRHTRRTASGECGFQDGVLGPCGAFLVPGCLSPSDLTCCACLLAWDSWVLVWSTRVCLAQ